MMLDDDAEGKVLGIEMLSLSKRGGKIDLNSLLFQTQGVAASA